MTNDNVFCYRYFKDGGVFYWVAQVEERFASDIMMYEVTNCSVKKSMFPTFDFNEKVLSNFQ